jgi:hypothetical protein
MKRQWTIRLLIVCGLIANFTIFPASAFQNVDECQVIACGPSGMFTQEIIPTVANINFAAFPKNPPRPYEIRGRTWYVQAVSDDSAKGTIEKPFTTINRAIEVAQAGDAIQVGNGTYQVARDGGSGIILDKPGLILYAEQIGGVTLAPLSEETWTVIEASADNRVQEFFPGKPTV